MGGDEPNPGWWRQKRWWISGVLLVLLVIADLVAAFGFTSDKDVRGSILGLVTPLVALIAGGAALLNFQETRLQNQRTSKTTQDQLELARNQFVDSQARSQEQVELQRRGQVTERFSRAIEQLGQEGDGKLDIRIGAIYSLEQIAKESNELYWPIMEVLTTHLRHFRRTRQPAPASEKGTSAEPGPARLPPEAQAIATVIGRRRHEHDPPNQGLDLHEADLSGVVWSGAQLEGARLWGAQLKRAHLAGAQLKGAHLNGAQLEGANLEGAQLEGAGLSRAKLRGAHLNGAQLEGANLEGAQLEGAVLYNAQLKGAFLGRVGLEAAHLNGAQLEATDFTFGQLQGADLRNANLRRAQLVEAQLEGADLRGAQLQKAILMRAHLKGADLGGAQLQGAFVERADLQDATFGGANLQGTLLDRTNLQDTDLRGANLQDAMYLTQEQLDLAFGDEETRLPAGLTIKTETPPNILRKELLGRIARDQLG